jgi:hypothetical protein
VYIVLADRYVYTAYNPVYFSFTEESMGTEQAYGSSAFGIVVIQLIDKQIQIPHAEEYHRPDYDEMLSLVYGFISKYQVDKIYIDGINPCFIKSLNDYVLLLLDLVNF